MIIPSFLRHKLAIFSYFSLLSVLFVMIMGQVAASPSPDAIAIRVIPNPNHLSPSRWYKEQEFSGSPQSLIVDDYEAVRDGRTVYVNAANIIDNNFYTNIYIISYNQTAENQTIDIFGQILSHWKFNTNLPDPGNCSKTTSQSCLYSNQCPQAEYCTSKKAKIIRDVKRLASLREVNLVLAKYKKVGFPHLKSGSYITGASVSVWPSWQETLGKELGITMPLDPINKLGSCPAGYNPTTCWNQMEKRFADPSPTNNEFNLPDGSFAFVYTTTDGASYNLCANMESGLIAPADGSCLGNVIDKPCTDKDNDGYYLKGSGCNPVDCDDTKNFIHPGAAEACDTLDNNCDSRKDEGCDDDGDGFCDNSLKIYNNTSMCPNTKFIDEGMNGDDCDDTKANVYPGTLGCERTYCGDGQTQTNPQNDDGLAETCDDGNVVNGDGCNENCQIE